MNKKEIINKILDSLSVKLKTYGFKLQKSKGRFTKQVKNFTLVYDINFYNERNGYIAEPFVYIDVEEVAKIYQNITVKNTISYNNLHTIGGTVGILMAEENADGIFRKNPFLNFYFNDEDSLNGCIDFLVYCFENAALPYFEEYDTLNKIDNALNNNPDYLSKHLVINPLRCIIGLIIAKLLNKQNYNDLMSIYDKQIQIASIEYIQEFNNLKALFNNKL